MGFGTSLHGLPLNVVPALQSFKELKDWLVSLEHRRPSWAFLSFPPSVNPVAVGPLGSTLRR